MAKMIPPDKPDGYHKSEEIIFNILTNSPKAKKWTVFPQFYVGNPGSPLRPREIDFVVLIPELSSVLCLEVKGGEYDYRGREWWPRGKDKPLTPSPVIQAQSRMFALKNWWGKALVRETSLSLNVSSMAAWKKVSVGETSLSFINCVAFTDAKVSKEAEELANSADVSKTSLLMGSSDTRDLYKMVNRLEAYAAEMRQQPGMALTGDEFKQAQEELKELEKLMNRDVAVTDPTFYRTNLENLLPELLVLTPSQETALTLAKVNERCMIDGAAGTGKTVLAMESARQRCEDEGQTVGLMCSNPNLSRRFQRWAETLSAEKGGRVIVGTPASLLSGAFDDGDFQARHRQRLDASPRLEETLKRGNLDAGWDKFVDDTVADLERQSAVLDFLVVDEAQNLCDAVFLRLMDSLLKGGLSHGKWAVFGDFKNQNIVTPRRRNDSGNATDALREMGAQLTYFPLDTNCRNTREIAAGTSTICKIETPTPRGVHGPDVEFEYFDTEEGPENLLDNKIRDWRGKGFDSRQIVLLAGGDAAAFAFDTGRLYGGWPLVNIRDAALPDGADPVRVSGDNADGKLRYSDVYDFQGLESDLVILVLPMTERQTLIGSSATLPDYDHATRLLYTGMSRANAMLCIVADAGYKEFLEPVGLP